MRRYLLPLALSALCAWPSTAASAQTGPEPYRDPPFDCTVIDYGTTPPELPAPPDDPLCVRYDKRNATVADLDVVDFLAAEPGRIAIVLGKCSYWQQDRWAVRVNRQTTPVVEWSGSYWYDGRSGSAAGIMRDLRVAGQPADARSFIEALRPLLGDDAADHLESYSASGGGGGATFDLPRGFESGVCTTPSGNPDSDRTSVGKDAPTGVLNTTSQRLTGTASGGETALPDTGGDQALLVWSVAAVGALAIGHLARRFSRADRV